MQHPPASPRAQAALQEILSEFDIPGPRGPAEPLGRGLINDTYRVVAGGRGWVLQRVNPRVFPDPERIMANLTALTEHAARMPGSGLRVPALARSRGGVPYVVARDGALWRLMELVADGVSLTGLESLAQASEVGRALGRFHRLAAGLADGALGVSLPGFHHTPGYVERYLAVRSALDMEPADSEQGAAVRRCRDFIDRRLGLAEVLEGALAAGRIRPRVIHGDPKLDNILFHRIDGRALALIDLDTVQPGLLQHDLGDCLRSCCNRGGELPDSTLASTTPSARFDLEIAEAILCAYAAEMGPLFGEGDIAVLYDSIRLMPFELALRFFTDHLEGDVYFRVARRGQNLLKAQVQLALLADIESREAQIRGLIAAAFGGLDGSRAG